MILAPTCKHGNEHEHEDVSRKKEFMHLSLYDAVRFGENSTIVQCLRQ